LLPKDTLFIWKESLNIDGAERTIDIMPYDREADPKTILVVDDDLAVLGFIKCMLESCDHTVLLAHSAEIALRFAERDDIAIDLMVTDVVMADMNGPDLAQRVLASRPHLKVLFMSGYADSEVLRIKVLDRALEFLPKPLNSNDLLEMIRMMLAAPVQRSAAAGRS
jgi:two-component system, cell cycle sensor histidine kinase and response regulator CckA